MKKLLLAVTAALLTACGARDSGPSTAPVALDAPTPQEAAATAPPANAAELNKATQESSGATDATPADTALERMTSLPEKVQLPEGRWKAGVNYLPISPAQPTSAEVGEVEVLEFMWLGCPHCYALQPSIENWAKQKPAYVKFVQEHVMWGAPHRAHAKLLYTLQALKREDLVHKAFDEIHQRNNMLISLKGDDAETTAIQTAFAKANGVSEADFKREYTSFAINTRLQRADELNRRYRIESVPEVIINGKYRTDETMAGGKAQLLQLINDLAAAEKGR